MAGTAPPGPTAPLLLWPSAAQLEGQPQPGYSRWPQRSAGGVAGADAPVWPDGVSQPPRTDFRGPCQPGKRDRQRQRLASKERGGEMAINVQGVGHAVG